MSFDFNKQIETKLKPFISKDELTCHTLNEHPFFTKYKWTFKIDNDNVLHITQDNHAPINKCHFEELQAALYQIPNAFEVINNCAYIQPHNLEFAIADLNYTQRSNTTQVHIFGTYRTSDPKIFLQAIVLLLKLNHWPDKSEFEPIINFSSSSNGYLASKRPYTFTYPDYWEPEKIVKDYQYVVRTLLYCILPKYTSMFTFYCSMLSEYLITVGKHIHSKILNKQIPLFIPPHPDNLGELCSVLSKELSDIFPEDLTHKPADPSLYFHF